MNVNNKKNEWNEAYKNKDNYMFYPHEDVIRFISKYIVKRVGLNKYTKQCSLSDDIKVLDFGCGIGRHVKLLNEFNMDSYGFDLSKEAITMAKNNFREEGLTELVDKVIVADITNLPYENKYFDFMISHGVLDSMPFNIARSGLLEISRCLKDKGKIYFDLISEHGYICSDENFEKTITTNHEKNTIQTCFNKDRINSLIDGIFNITEIVLKTEKNLQNDFIHGRYHIVVEKILNE